MLFMALTTHKTVMEMFIKHDHNLPMELSMLVILVSSACSIWFSPRMDDWPPAAGGIRGRTTATGAAIRIAGDMFVDGRTCFGSTLLLRDFGRGRPEITSLCKWRDTESCKSYGAQFHKVCSGSIAGTNFKKPPTSPLANLCKINASKPCLCT